MIIGVDFDNTIVCYDRLFHRLALHNGLIPADIPQSKTAIRDYLRSIDQEKSWTQLQGLAYGPQIKNAQPFDSVKDFFSLAATLGHKIYIVSHKTLHPFEGPKYNLHQAAIDWLNHNSFFSEKINFTNNDVFLELTKQDKINRIKEIKCDIFIDDLPELLTDSDFSNSTEKYLFDPNGEHHATNDLILANSWSNLIKLILK